MLMKLKLKLNQELILLTVVMQTDDPVRAAGWSRAGPRSGQQRADWSEEDQEEFDPESLQGTQKETLRWAAPVSPGQNGPVRAKFGRSLDEL